MEALTVPCAVRRLLDDRTTGETGETETADPRRRSDATKRHEQLLAETNATRGPIAANGAFGSVTDTTNARHPTPRMLKGFKGDHPKRSCFKGRL